MAGGTTYWMDVFWCLVWYRCLFVSVCILTVERVFAGVKCIHWPVYFPPGNPHCDPVSRAPNWCVALSQDPNMLLLCFLPPLFPSIRCAAQLQLSRSHRGILVSVGLGPQDTEPSFHGDFTNTPGPERTSLWQGGTMETGTDHKAQFLGIPMPGITPESCRRQRSSEDRGVGAQRVMRFFRRPSDWLERNRVAILVRCTRWMLTSLWGCSRVHSLKKKKKSGEVWQDKVVDVETD